MSFLTHSLTLEELQCSKLEHEHMNIARRAEEKAREAEEKLEEQENKLVETERTTVEEKV